MKKMKIIDGDVFDSNADAILHQVNCQGVMGNGVAKQVRKKYPNVFAEYKELCNKHKNNTSALLGYVLEVECGDVFILNCFAQDKYGTDRHRTINSSFKGKRLAIPYLIGCGLGGGDRNVVREIIEKELCDCNVTLYRYKG